MKRSLLAVCSFVALLIWAGVSAVPSYAQTPSSWPADLPKPSANDCNKPLAFTRYDMKPEKAVAESEQLLNRLGLPHQPKPLKVWLTCNIVPERVVQVEWVAKVSGSGDPRYEVEFDSVYGLLVHFMNYAGFYSHVRGYRDNRRDTIETVSDAKHLLLHYARCLEPSLPSKVKVVRLWMRPPVGRMNSDAIEGNVGLPLPGGYGIDVGIWQTDGIPVIEMTLSRHTGALIEANVGYPPSPHSYTVDPPVVHISKPQAEEIALKVLRDAMAHGRPLSAIQPGATHPTITEMRLCYYDTMFSSLTNAHYHLCWMLIFDKLRNGKPDLFSVEATVIVIDANNGKILHLQYPPPPNMLK